MSGERSGGCSVVIPLDGPVGEVQPSAVLNMAKAFDRTRIRGCEVLIATSDRKAYNRMVSLRERRPHIRVLYLRDKTKKALVRHAIAKASHERVCLVNNLATDPGPLPKTFSMLDKHDFVVGELNPRGYTAYTRFFKRNRIAVVFFRRLFYLSHDVEISEILKHNPRFSIARVQVPPLPDIEKHTIPKHFRPLSSLLSFLVYPHPSEHESNRKTRVSIDRGDFLSIPEIHSARKTLTAENVGFFAFVALLIALPSALLFYLFGLNPFLVLIGAVVLLYLGNSTLKLYLSHVTVQSNFYRRPIDISSLEDKRLPYYTILVPLYKEAAMVRQIASNIKSLDWPKDKLDVKLLLEEDDVETIRAVKKARLPGYFETVIIPHSQPKGKPKALNVGLSRVRGKYLVIYDAEDIPEPDQLKKAYVTLKSSPPDVAGVHAKLNFYNKSQNWLTRLFTSEYSYWYELCLPSLIERGFAVPLGGNSVHFKVSVLKKIGAWDPYNVTEDCELGMRLLRRGYTIRLLDSRTREEAVTNLRVWIRQRSRWMKGFIQTSIVNLRHPTRLLRELGWKRFISFILIVPGTPLIHLLNIVFWFLTIGWFVSFSPAIKSLFPWYILYPSMFSFVFGNFAMVYLSMLGCVAKRQYGLVKWALLSPVYWVMMAAGTAKAFWQMLTSPHSWEKTKHGFHREAKA